MNSALKIVSTSASPVGARAVARQTEFEGKKRIEQSFRPEVSCSTIENRDERP
jgi:hypothetical protein